MEYSTSEEQGLGKLTLLIFGTLVAGCCYVAYNILPFYYYYYELRNQMEALTKVASTHTDQELKKKLLYHIKKMEIPLTPDEVMIVRDEGLIEMSAEYDEVFYISIGEKDYDIHTFHFHAYVEGRM